MFENRIHMVFVLSYADALAKTTAELVYISLVNGEHERWARAALDRGLHVIVDKPAFLGRAPAEELLELAARKGVCLAEATVFAYHPQIAALKQAFVDAGAPPTRIGALFSFPAMNPENFRYRSGLGGGALWDTGPYLTATGRIFFGEEPTSVNCTVLARGGADNVEIAYSASATFAGGRGLVGQFGFDTAYVNRLEILGPRLAAEADRVFTTPPDLANTLLLARQGGSSTAEIPPADAFRIFFDHVVRSIEAQNWNQLGAELLSDARTLERYRVAAGVT